MATLNETVSFDMSVDSTSVGALAMSEAVSFDMEVDADSAMGVLALSPLILFGLGIRTDSEDIPVPVVSLGIILPGVRVLRDSVFPGNTFNLTIR